MASKQQPDQFFDFDITKYMGDFKVPGIDVESLVASQKKNIEALTQANKTAFEGMQALAKRQTELLRQTMEEITSAGKQMAEPGTAQEKAAKQAEMTKQAFERALENMREMSEMVTKANDEAAKLLNKRFVQMIDEYRDALLAAGKK